MGVLKIKNEDGNFQEILTIKGTDGIDGTHGVDGQDGYTPIKGTDYFTQSDIDEIVSIVVEQAIGDINTLLGTINGEVIK